MVAPRNLISLRLSEEELAAIDQRIGLDGVRNRSDLLRKALATFLADAPELPGQEKVSVLLGATQREQLRILYQLTGDDANQILKIALQEYLIRTPERLEGLTEKLTSLAEESVKRTSPHRSYKR